MNRTEIAKALAKALAYKQCGNQALAEQWAARLVQLLECQGILTHDAQTEGEDLR